MSSRSEWRWLEGAPKKGVGPHDVAISLVKATFESGFVKNKVLEFAGPGVKNLPIDFRNGIDIMTTETTCLSSIWVTDDEVKHHYELHKRWCMRNHSHSQEELMAHIEKLVNDYVR